MALKAVLESLDGVDEALRDLYIEKEIVDPQTKKSVTVHVLDIVDVQTHPDVLGLKASRDKLLNEKKTVEKRLAEVEKKAKALPEDFDPEELEQLREAKQELEDLKASDPEKKKAYKAFEDKLTKLTKKMDDAVAEREATIKQKNAMIERIVARDGLAAELAKNGVKKEAISFVQAKLERSVKVVEDDDGELVAMFNTDLGEKPVAEYIREWVQTDEAKLFVEPAKGAGATGSGGAGGFHGPNPYSAEHWNGTEQHKLEKVDMRKADALARSAGHKNAISAVRAMAR